MGRVRAPVTTCCTHLRPQRPDDLRERQVVLPVLCEGTAVTAGGVMSGRVDVASVAVTLQECKSGGTT
jgi:hypothetical protein